MEKTELYKQLKRLIRYNIDDLEEQSLSQMIVSICSELDLCKECQHQFVDDYYYIPEFGGKMVAISVKCPICGYRERY